MMLDRFDPHSVVIGRKQTLRAVRAGEAKEVFLASDAAPVLRAEIESACREKRVSLHFADSMIQLGHAVGIEVGASACAVIRT